MSFKYDFNQLKEAILFNTAEVLPGDPKQLDQEIQTLVDQANQSGEKIRHYIGFEISGKLHFGNNTYQMLKVAKLQQAGVECVIWLADYHTFINKKLDGKIETIHKVAKTYFEPVMRKTLDNCGGDSQKLQVLYAKDEYRKYDKNDLSFWDFELECEEYITVSRTLRSLSIAGKVGGESSSYKLTRYVGMQAADVFWLKTHIVQSGLDQRKIYVSCRDIADKIDPKYGLKINQKSVKPIAIFSSLLLGMKPPENQNQATEGKTLEAGKKMSKSNPDSAIFEDDDFEEISRKLKKAYCPMINKDLSDEENEQIQDLNPLLDWCKKMIFPANKILEVIRPEKFGGNKTYQTFEELKTDYFRNSLHPLDLKNAVAKCLSDWFAPIREYVQKNPEGLELIKNSKK